MHLIARLFGLSAFKSSVAFHAPSGRIARAASAMVFLLADTQCVHHRNPNPPAQQELGFIELTRAHTLPRSSTREEEIVLNEGEVFLRLRVDGVFPPGIAYRIKAPGENESIPRQNGRQLRSAPPPPTGASLQSLMEPMRAARQRAEWRVHCRIRNMSDVIAAVAIATELDENASYRAMQHHKVSFAHFALFDNQTKPTAARQLSPPVPFGEVPPTDYCSTDWAAKLSPLPWEVTRDTPTAGSR